MPVSIQPGDLGSKYNDFLDTEVVNDVADLKDGDITIRANGQLAKPKRLDNGLYAFKDDTGFDRVVLTASQLRARCRSTVDRNQAQR